MALRPLLKHLIFSQITRRAQNEIGHFYISSDPPALRHTIRTHKCIQCTRGQKKAIAVWMWSIENGCGQTFSSRFQQWTTRSTKHKKRQNGPFGNTQQKRQTLKSRQHSEQFSPRKPPNWFQMNSNKAILFLVAIASKSCNFNWNW